MNLDRAYSIPADESAQLRKLQTQLDAVVNEVSLGVILVDQDGVSLVNPVAARLLGLSAGPGAAVDVAEAMARRRAGVGVHVAAGMDLPLPKFSAKDVEFWELPDNGGMIQVESRPTGSDGEPGWLWIFTD